MRRSSYCYRMSPLELWHVATLFTRSKANIGLVAHLESPCTMIADQTLRSPTQPDVSLSVLSDLSEESVARAICRAEAVSLWSTVESTDSWEKASHAVLGAAIQLSATAVSVAELAMICGYGERTLQRLLIKERRAHPKEVIMATRFLLAHRLYVRFGARSFQRLRRFAPILKAYEGAESSITVEAAATSFATSSDLLRFLLK